MLPSYLTFCPINHSDKRLIIDNIFINLSAFAAANSARSGKMRIATANQAVLIFGGESNETICGISAGVELKFYHIF